MLRIFVLTFAAVTLRLLLPVFVVAGLDFPVAYAAVAWACWAPNAVFAEWWLRAKPAPQSA